MGKIKRSSSISILWKKPKSGGKPKRITTKNPPGGPETPGAKAKKKK